MKYINFLASVFLIMTLHCVAQVTDKVSESRGTMDLLEGRRYMVAYPQVWNSPTEIPAPQPMVLFISSRVKAKVRVQTPSEINDAGRFDREYTLKPNEVQIVEISVTYMNKESESRTGYGIFVTSDKPISVSTYQAWMGNGELARNLPVEAWGKNYYTMNFYQDRYGAANGYKYRPSQILVVAAYDNTVVSYTPTFATEGGRETPSIPKKGTGQVTLNKGDTYLIKAQIDENLNKDFRSDLTGTWIRSSRPVGVISGHTKVAIMRYPDVLPPTGNNMAEAHFVRNNVHDAMLPIEMGGTKFVTVPSMYTQTRVTGKASADFGIDDDRGDVIRVVALEDNTTIKALRTNGEGFLNKWKLNRGETALETALETATYWESDKPILMGHYGKSYAKIIPPGGIVDEKSNGHFNGIGKEENNTQGHPTVESGMPMLQYVPSTDRWVSYAVFHAPEGMDNFFNIVFTTEDVVNIKIDGRALNSAFGGAMRPLQGTPYSYIRTPIGAGDHVVESVKDEVKWTAWTYGSLDGLQQGRAYGTPVAVDLAIPCDDSLNVTETIVCGNVTAVGTILPENSVCGSIFGVYAEDLVNYTLVEDAAFNPGDKKVNFWLNVNDPKKDASGKVRVVTRSGKFVEKTYTYTADKFDFDPKKIDFGVIPFKTPVCKEVRITNLRTDAPLDIKEVRAKYFPNVYKFTPTTTVIPPGGSAMITVCATITDTREKLDTMIVKLGCYEQLTTELRVRGEEPVIFVTDQEWKDIPAASAGVKKKVEIVNGNTVDLIITGYDETLVAGQDKFFDFQTTSGAPLSSIFPMTLKFGERYTFNVTYSPRGEAGVSHTLTVPFFSNAISGDSLAILKGNGIQSNISAIIEAWNVRVLDNIQTNQGIIQYTQKVPFSNIGTLGVEFQQPVISGPDAASFRIVDNGDAQFPITLIGGTNQQERYINVSFVPIELPNRAGERNNYVAQLEFPNNSGTSLIVELNGTAWQPEVKGADYDFGTFQVGDARATQQIKIVNEHYQDATNPTSGDTKGTHDVTVTGIRFVGTATNFTVDYAPTPASPWRLAPGESRDITVSFDPATSGTYAVDYEVVTQPTDMTDGAAPYTPVYKLTAVVTGGDFTVQGSDAEQYVYNSKDMTIQIRHTENSTRRYIIGTPQGSDAGNFSVVEPYVDVAPGQVGIVNVKFIPTAVTKIRNGQDQAFLSSAKASAQSMSFRGTKYNATVDIQDEANGKTQTATITGDGLFLETTNFVGSYNVEVAKTVDVPIELRGTPEAVDASGLNELRLRISYDSKLIKPRLNAIVTNGTQMQGGQFIKVEEVSPGHLEIDIRSAQAITSNGGPLFALTFDAFMGTGSDPSKPFTSPIGVYTYPVDFDGSDGIGVSKQYVLFHDIPGQVVVSQLCAKTLRLVSMSNTRFSVKPIAPNPVSGTAVINYSIGLAGHTRIALFNSSGILVTDLVNENQSIGNYELTIDVTTLPAGTYVYRVISGDYISEPQVLIVVHQ